MSRAGEGLRRVEEEIRREKAAALGRAGERLDEVLHEVAELGRQLDAATSPAAREHWLVAYEKARGRAERARLMLLIQREAVGLRHHATVAQQFPEPPRRARPGRTGGMP